MIKLLRLLPLFLCFSAWADSPYINLFGGFGAHNQQTMEDSNTRPTGLAYGVGIGRRLLFYEFELNVSKGQYSSEIEHDGQANTLINDQLQVTLALNFYLITKLYLRLGYSLTSLEQTTETPVSGASGEGLVKEYGLKDEKVDGVVLGGGYSLISAPKMSIYLQYEYFMLSSIKATQHLMSAGMRWYF